MQNVKQAHSNLRQFVRKYTVQWFLARRLKGSTNQTDPKEEHSGQTYFGSYRR